MKFVYRVIFNLMKAIAVFLIHLSSPFKGVKLYFTNKEIIVPDPPSTLFISAVLLYFINKQWIKEWNNIPDWLRQTINNIITVIIVIVSLQLVWIPVVSCLSILLQSVGNALEIEWLKTDIILRYLNLFGATVLFVAVCMRANLQDTFSSTEKPCCYSTQPTVKHKVERKKHVHFR